MEGMGKEGRMGEGRKDGEEGRKERNSEKLLTMTDPQRKYGCSEC